MTRRIDARGPLGFFVLMLGFGLRLDTAWQGSAWVVLLGGAALVGLALRGYTTGHRHDAFESKGGEG